MVLAEQPPERHRQIAGLFDQKVHGTGSWHAPTPVGGWTARDVVGHLTGWLPDFLAAGAGVNLARATVDDPVVAWQIHVDAVQALLDDPATSRRTLANPHIGELPLDLAIDRFYTADVFMHTWDLARATGQDDELDSQFCAELLAGMEPIEDVMRSSGQFGARVPVADDADAQTRMLGFIGRDPAWSPATPAA